MKRRQKALDSRPWLLTVRALDLGFFLAGLLLDFLAVFAFGLALAVSATDFLAGGA